MEYSQHTTPVFRPWLAVLVTVVFCLSAAPVSAETYRWKDKDGKVHYGVTIPAEYAEQPYDILNDAGIVIEHVEDTTIPQEIIEQQKEELGRQPLISEEERRIQTDKLLVIQYESEEAIIKALELELAQLGYDSRIIDQSYESTSVSIRNQIRQVADLQRAGQEISTEQQQEIASLYKRQARDKKRQSAMQQREEEIRARFQQDLDRYRALTSEEMKNDEEQVDQG